MKNKILSTVTYLITGGLLLMVSSCNESKYLDTIPPTQVNANDIFDTPSRILGLVNGTYKSLKDANYFGGRFQLYLDVRGEDFINTTGNSFTGYDSWANRYNSGSNDINNLWTAAYATINQANIIIDGIPKNPGIVSDELGNQYIAEAKFLRALSYYSIVTVFGQPYNKNNGTSPGVPLRLQPETTMENNDLARSTVAAVYAQVLKDLNDAEAGLPTDYTGSTALTLKVTRAHRNTAIALKTRVYLNMGNYAKVVEEAKKIVPQTVAPFSATTGVKHALQSNIVSVITTDYTTTESILSAPFSTLDMYSGQSAIGYIYNNVAEYYLNPTGILGSSQWPTTDARRGFLRASGSTNYLSKFGRTAPYLIYMPLIRYSEVLLNYAEAAAETGDLTLATNLLKAVHARSDASYTFPASATATKDALISSILVERRIELLGEGFRSNDLLRRLQTIPAKTGPTVSANAVSPAAENYIWPISNSEIVNNRLINQ
ncbi:RagB/SusD family nutrient uptake outer membrane protein [Siphonobacter sp. SORGH_AS_0500]|uniref:RagB/SusD family nutrient uptake outer membrane protein n=1 Tax=Siphonobacter sp. SORGH_AS_0500 TaxID=1864824 RepID=UPI0018E30B2C|nr:RagB/SusD family nutrient uptake outer membrane protein [Siphonobacter sp. SORGH_AS_0500]